ncbi:Zona pellucida-binding protein 2 [Acipenser ruthenus]|uniref:Zona pellucida-binding protein 2 n=1 Tax=Acipenser ruthenus TaxID=7906 RepID=A0A444UNL1_ACIRT|nr:Zona pellucida-binding protein 2 [Acipenser ruthenus]
MAIPTTPPSTAPYDLPGTSAIETPSAIAERETVQAEAVESNRQSDSKLVTFGRANQTGFHRPDRSLKVDLAFLTAACQQGATARFMQTITPLLHAQVSDLGCEITETSAACHPLPRNTGGRVRVELIIFPYGTLWDQNCPPVKEGEQRDCDTDTDMRIKQAYSRLQLFLSVHGQFELVSPEPLQLRYEEGSLGGVRISHCKPGFGKDHGQRECPNCCLVCSPGSSSSVNSAFCSACPKGSYSARFGSVECFNCRKNYATTDEGSTSREECIPGNMTGWMVMFVCLFAVLLLLSGLMICMLTRISCLGERYVDYNIDGSPPPIMTPEGKEWEEPSEGED